MQENGSIIQLAFVEVQPGVHGVFVLLHHIDLVVKLGEPFVACLGELELDSWVVAILLCVLLDDARGRLLRLLVNVESPMHILLLLPVANIGVIAFRC